VAAVPRRRSRLGIRRNHHQQPQPPLAETTALETTEAPAEAGRPLADRLLKTERGVGGIEGNGWCCFGVVFVGGGFIPGGFVAGSTGGFGFLSGDQAVLAWATLFLTGRWAPPGPFPGSAGHQARKVSARPSSPAIRFRKRLFCRLSEIVAWESSLLQNSVRGPHRLGLPLLPGFDLLYGDRDRL